MIFAGKSGGTVSAAASFFFAVYYIAKNIKTW